MLAKGSCFYSQIPLLSDPQQGVDLYAGSSLGLILPPPTSDLGLGLLSTFITKDAT